MSSVRESGNTPCLSIRPSLVLNPTMPQKLAGARIEPPVSLPIAQGARPPATATAAPDEDPPATRGVAGSRGFLGVPKCGLSPSAEKANSERLVLPKATMPAAARFVTIGASFSFAGDLGIERRSCGGALARHVDEVLPRDGHAIERARCASFAVTFAARLRFLQGPLARDEMNDGLS